MNIYNDTKDVTMAGHVVASGAISSVVGTGDLNGDGVQTTHITEGTQFDLLASGSQDRKSVV